MFTYNAEGLTVSEMQSDREFFNDNLGVLIREMQAHEHLHRYGRWPAACPPPPHCWFIEDMRKQADHWRQLQNEAEAAITRAIAAGRS